MIVVYESNNSGGDWWLTDEDWLRLEAAGWKVAWVKDNARHRSRFGSNERWLGALATKASKDFENIEAAVADWASVTGLDPFATGCGCCGQPHFFRKDWEDE